MNWISVKDRLPEDGQGVIACIDFPVVSIFTCDFDKELGFCDMWAIENDDRFYIPFNHNVTHWMPLPEPPRDGE